MSGHLVVDVGTSGLRALVIRPDGTVTAEHYRQLLPSSPMPGFVEFDAVAMASVALDLAAPRALAQAGPVASVGIASQRASTIVWDRATGQPVGPGIGWQDLRTAGMCLMLGAQGIKVPPNVSATKLQFLLDMYDAARDRDLCFGTVDSWIVWTLTQGGLHVIDATNAGVTGLVAFDERSVFWNQARLEAMNIPERVLPRIVDSTGVLGPATALPGAPPIAGIVGDQQASLVGQGCVRPGLAKITFGTGAMLDVCTGRRHPAGAARNPSGTIPIVGWQQGGTATWGAEGIMISAGTSVEWLRDDLQLISTAAESEAVAGVCEDTGDVWFVPALLGLGTPVWDYGARGTLVGLTRGSGRAEIVRAVLEGVAHRGVDLVDAAEADTGLQIPSLRVDGGMSVNAVFVQALADAAQRPVEVSPMVEATALGAAYLAGLATGTWSSFDEIASLWKPARVVEPRPGRSAKRDRWLEARERSLRWLPDFSALDF